MPRGNPQNLKPEAHKLTVEDQSKGGKKSGRARREKKTTQELMIQILNSGCSDFPKLQNTAKKLGLEEQASVKKLMAFTGIIRTIKTGDIDKIIKLCEFIGENNQQIASQTEDDALSIAIMETAEQMKKDRLKKEQERKEQEQQEEEQKTEEESNDQ